MFLYIGHGINDALEELRELHCSNSSHETFIQSLEYFLGMRVAKDRRKKTEAPKLGTKSTPNLRKWPRERTMNP